MTEVIDTTDKVTNISEENTPTLASEGQEGEDAPEEAVLTGEQDFSMLSAINSEYVQVLCESIQNVGNSDTELKGFMKRAITSIVSLAKTVTKANGPAIDLINRFVNEVRQKVDQLADSLA